MLRSLALATLALLATTLASLAQQSFPGGPNPMVCTFNATLPTLASGQTGFVQCDANGRLLNTGGGGAGSSTITSPVGSNTKAQSVSVTYATDQLLPAFAAAPTVILGAGSATVGSIANTGFNALQAGSATSVTNPLIAGLAQGGAALSSTNPLPENLVQVSGTALGPPTAYGTAPTGNALGVNANVTASALPSGAATSANQTSEITQLTNANTRVLNYTDVTNQTIAASGGYSGTARTPGTAYTRFNVSASCTQAANLYVYASNDAFAASSSLIATATIAAGGLSGSITTSIVFTSYKLSVAMGATGGTCNIASSATVN